mmetsp:Transcript_7710/g.19619  ORF Transcript_7710/g.19619 Transcript_7710/m.19619 type:complete len:229 (+) Transcript_7710:58-744(+)|eukprot:CAMPEP_0115218978 /NCGR_PEP_ID=MMETSP0270-20121206/26675_1 /TAXON_ID=71861 /ORGANISM="Scrippsiella trochoidea, Strain CCMP3099" /LENGTH=228 /DNA_ID=CAMNT_0002632949 /DNA_START=45 /DNA_END=731 /DNA_ORIENTATION=+
MEALLVRKVNGEALDISLRGASSVADVRQRVAVALDVHEREYVQVKLMNGAREVGDEVAVDTLDMDVGLLAVLTRLVPDWYPRHKYVHGDREVLRITGTAQGRDDFVAEFTDGSTQNVGRALYEQAVGEWSWREVARSGRLWAHPPEKPAESGGWYDIFTAENARKGAVRSAGAIAGFLVGCAPDSCTSPGLNGEGDFATSFQIGYLVGLTAWGLFQVGRVVAYIAKK